MIIQIPRNEGRTVEQKKALTKAIADGLSADVSLRQEHINPVKVRRENQSFGAGIAQWLSPEERPRIFASGIGHRADWPLTTLAAWRII